MSEEETVRAADVVDGELTGSAFIPQAEAEAEAEPETPAEETAAEEAPAEAAPETPVEDTPAEETSTPEVEAD